jgi:ribose-phosphate pyrophosphokinase
VIPYFGYARQDRKDKGRTPITAKLVANQITTAGFQRVLTIDLHAAQIQGFFDLPVDHLSAIAVFNGYFQGVRDELGDLVVVSPDVGNVKVAQTYADLLDADLAIIEKRRLSGDQVRHGAIVGEVRNKTVLMIDDMISTAGTVCEAARLVADRGASSVIVAATHALLCGPAIERLADAPIGRVVITDTIPGRERYAPIADKVVELGVAELFAEAIHHIHHNLSVSALFHRLADSKR